MKTYKPLFRRLHNVFEFLPNITYYINRGAYLPARTLTIGWLKWALVFDLNWVAKYFNTKEK